MKIYKLNLDVDNYQGCFINETNLTKRDFKEINRGRKLTFKEGCITFNYANDEGLKIGDVIRCWDFRGLLINNRTYNIFNKNEKFEIQYIRFQDDFILLNNLKVIDALNNDKTVFEYLDNDIIGVEKYCFKMLDFPPLFQTSRFDGIVDMKYFVTDEFLNIVNENQLKGFKFIEAWDSEKD